MISRIFVIISIFDAAISANEWFMLNHGSGSPVRCNPNGDGIQCASDNNKDCKWGTYGSKSNYAKMSGVTAAAPLLGSCPGWPPNDGSNACDVLGCDDQYRFYYLNHGAGSPVRCNPNVPDELQCASDDGYNCKWGQYSAQTPYTAMINVVSKNPGSTSCPGWPTDDGRDACAELNCYSVPPAPSRDCSVLAIDEFLLQCSSEFPAQQTAISDLDARITQLDTDITTDVTQNANDITQLQTDLTNGNTGTSAQITTLQQDLDNVNSRIDLFAAKSVAGMIDNSHSNNFNILSVLTLKDLALILLLSINLLAVCYIGFCKNGNNKKQDFAKYNEGSDVEQVNLVE